MLWFQYLFFFVSAAIALSAAAGVVASRQPIHSALFLLLHFAMLAVLYITLDAQFLGVVQVIIYAGGIVILMLFVIMLLGSEKLVLQAWHRSWIPRIALGLAAVLLVAMGFSLWQAFGDVAPNPGPNLGGIPEKVGLELFTKYILPFELVGILLLVALLGALLVARRNPEESKSA
jgi:NADH-quinone oxidoreductase subunit J